MSFSSRYLPAVLFVFFSLTVSLFAQSATKQTTKAPRGTVSGRVTIKDKGAAGVAVGLRKSEFNNPFEPFLRATTDQDGFYRITNVPAGSYFVAPSAPAFVIADNYTGRGKNVVMGEGENVEGINFSLIRGGVITGKITDADGRPVIQQRVNLYRADAFDQQAQQAPQRPVFASGGAQTDDRGIYRIFGLSAGRYKVAAGRSDDVYMGNVSLMRTSYKQVFYPDATEHSKAAIIEVSEGSEAKDIDIKLGASLQTYSVSGRVVEGETGVPVPNTRFGLQRMVGERPEFVQTSLMSNAQGDFFAEGLLPGTYGIFLFGEQNRELRADTYSFAIIDQDVTGAVIKLTKGASLSGVVVVDSEDPAVLQQLLKMQLMAYVTSPEGRATGFGQSSSSPISPDGSFRLAGLPPGNANLSLGGPSMGPFGVKGFAISRIERDGVSMPRGVEVREGEQVGGLRVVVSYGNATLRGVVKLENGTLPAGAQIFLRLTRVGESFSGLRPPPVDARGRFLMEGIPPGNYELIVQVPVGRGTPRREKREISLQDGVVTDVEITIDMGTTPKP